VSETLVHLINTTPDRAKELIVDLRIVRPNGVYEIGKPDADGLDLEMLIRFGFVGVYEDDHAR